MILKGAETMRGKEFKEALVNRELELLRKIPKTDLHNHSGLGMRFSTFNQWCGGNIKPPPEKINGLLGLEEYLSKETANHVDSKAGFEFMMTATIEEAIRDGVTVLETSIDSYNMLYYKDAEEYFKYISGLIEKYSSEIDLRPEIGVHRAAPLVAWEEGVIPCIDSKVFKSLDMYGVEAVNNMDLYKRYFDYANKRKIKTKVHVGEFCGVEQLIETIEALNPCELQHGLSSVQSQKAIDLIKERNIKLNICPSSNTALGSVKDIKNHQLKELFNQGVMVTINTDDLLLFNRSVSEEFIYVYDSGLLGADELNEIRLNGFR